MTEDQIKELATVSANVRHLLGFMESIQRSLAGLEERMRTTLDGLATRKELQEFVTVTHHDAEVKAIGVRMDRIEKMIEAQSPSSLWDRGAKIATGILAFAAAVSLILYSRAS